MHSLYIQRCHNGFWGGGGLFFCDQKCSLYGSKGMAFLDLLSKNTN